jgi:aryl carrier-like protein
MQMAGHEALVAQGIQFRVLAHAFPVLRHDAIKPISNAKLAAAMMQKNADNGHEHSEERTQQLLTDLDFMLDEGVDTVRLLAEWLSDAGKLIDIDTLLRTCTKLLFTHLLLSGKKVSQSDGGNPAEVPLYSGRYVMLAWLLHMVESMPDGAELVLDYTDGTRLSASLNVGAGSTPLRPSDSKAAPVMPLQCATQLASYHGWELERVDSGWTLALPLLAQPQNLAA